MRLLLDTHVVLGALGLSEQRMPRAIAALLHSENDLTCSVASLWEIALKMRRGKLGINIPLSELPGGLVALGLQILDITVKHVLHDLTLLPSTNDPFDRLLLSVAEVEHAALVTIDGQLIQHPLAWRPA